MICLATPRLLLRTWRADDGPSLVRLARAEGTANSNAALFGATLFTADADTAVLTTSVDRFERSWVTNGRGVFALESFDSGQLVGLAGVQDHPTDPAMLELLWQTRSFDSHSAEAIAVEALTAVVDWTFGSFEVTAVEATVRLGNEAAATVASDVGLSVASRTLDATSDTWVDRFRMTASEWNEAL